MRKQAEMQLGFGNKEADRGNLEKALAILNDASNLAISADDASLRIRTRLSRCNVLFTLGQREEAEKGWNEALAEAQSLPPSGAGSAELAAVCRIHIARGRLLADKSAARAVREDVGRDIELVKKNRLYAAFAWMVIGLAEKEQGRYKEAEAAVRNALEIHEKDRYFELAAYNWFMIASFRSLALDYPAARQALEMAIGFDRRIENSWGLANDWRALGEVQSKAQDRPAAQAAFRRAAEIYDALRHEAAAEEMRAKIDG